MVSVFDRRKSSSFKFRKIFERQSSDSRVHPPMEVHQVSSPMVYIPNKISSNSRKETVINNKPRKPATGNNLYFNILFLGFSNRNLLICSDKGMVYRSSFIPL